MSRPESGAGKHGEGVSVGGMWRGCVWSWVSVRLCPWLCRVGFGVRGWFLLCVLRACGWTDTLQTTLDRVSTQGQQLQQRRGHRSSQPTDRGRGVQVASGSRRDCIDVGERKEGPPTVGVLALQDRSWWGGGRRNSGCIGGTTLQREREEARRRATRSPPGATEIRRGGRGVGVEAPGGRLAHHREGRQCTGKCDPASSGGAVCVEAVKGAGAQREARRRRDKGR